MQFIGKDCTTICHSKLSIPIMADLFAPATSVDRAGSPSYTDSALPVIQIMALLAQNSDLQTPLLENM